MAIEQSKLQNALQFISKNIADKKNIEYKAENGEVNLELFEDISSEELKEEVDKLSKEDDFKDIFKTKKESDLFVDALYSMIDTDGNNSLSNSELRELANNYDEKDSKETANKNGNTNTNASSNTISLSSFIALMFQVMQSVLSILLEGTSNTSSSTPSSSNYNYQAPSFGYSYSPSVSAPTYGYSSNPSTSTGGSTGSYDNTAYSSYNTSDGNIKSLLDVASGEVGQREATGNNDGAAVKKYGRGQSGYAWCANFVSWCLEEGLGKNNPMRRSSYCPDIVAQAKKQGAWAKQGSGYTPQAGDVILFDWDRNGAANHVGIVEKVENGKVYTIEGNSKNSVKRNTYNLNSNDILGYYQIEKAQKAQGKA